MVKRYGEIAAKKNLWNTERIGPSKNAFSDSRATAFYQQNGCVMNAPALNGLNWSTLQREAENIHVLHVEPLRSPRHDQQPFRAAGPIGMRPWDYDYPVWFWFIVASDSTILYCAPLPHCPVTYWGYDPDDTGCSTWECRWNAPRGRRPSATCSPSSCFR